jgi:AcrR family transcriptional regulator
VTDVDQVAMVPSAVETNRERVSRRQVDKFAERRAQLADAALQTLAELGYARTSLREIAQNTEFSHGVLHYYFSDKEELITHCVRQYEAACVTRYDEIVASASSAGELKRYASFGEFSIALSAGAAYAILDGLFQQALLHHLAGDEDAAEVLRANVVRVLDGLEVRDSR